MSNPKYNLERQGVLYTTQFRKHYDLNSVDKRKMEKNPKFRHLVDGSKLFFGTKSKSYISYISRKTAVDKKADTKALELNRVLDRKSLSGVWDKSGTLTEKELSTYQTLLAKSDLGLDNVISFSKPYGEAYIHNVLDAKRYCDMAFKKEMELRKLNPDDFYYLGALHTNTRHLHIHYIIFPKEKMMKYNHFIEKSDLKEKTMNKRLYEEYPNSLPMVVPMVPESPKNSKEFFFYNDYTSEGIKEFLKDTPNLHWLFVDVFINKNHNGYNSSIPEGEEKENIHHRKLPKGIDKESKSIVRSYLWKYLVSSLLNKDGTPKNKTKLNNLLSYSFKERDEIIGKMYDRLVLYFYDKEYREAINNIAKGGEIVLFNEKDLQKLMREDGKIGLWKHFESKMKASNIRRFLEKFLKEEKELTGILDLIKLDTFDANGYFSKAKHIAKQEFKEIKGKDLQHLKALQKDNAIHKEDAELNERDAQNDITPPRSH